MVTDCRHEVEHLVGTKDGIKCRNCGKMFASFAELVADRPKLKKEQVEEVTEKPTEEKPAEKPKKATKKGGK